MQSDKSVLTALTMAALAVMLAFTVVPGDVDAAEQHFDEDRGKIWGMGAGFVFSGSDAETIEWDFGDGTPVSNEWNVEHIYAEKGVYYVTQTLTNSFNGGSTTTTVYKIEIMGYPTVTFDTHGGSAVAPIQMDRVHGTITAPEDPVKDGAVFKGWFFDAEYSQPYDWAYEINFPVTLHAKWEAPAVITHTVSFDVLGGSTPVADMTVEEGKQVKLPAYDGTLEGKDFKCWKLGTTEYVVGSSITVNSDMRFVAVWIDEAIVIHKVSFDVLGGSTSVADMVVEDGKQVKLPAYDGTLEGKEFKCWKLGTTEYSVGSSVTVDSDMRFTAVWKDKAVVPGPGGDDNQNPGGDDNQNPGGDDKEPDGSTEKEDNVDQIVKFAAFALVSVTGVLVVVFIVRRLI